MSQKGKLNTEEKVEIIKKYRQGEISLVQAARDAGVGTTTIYRWSARYETEDVYKRQHKSSVKLKSTPAWV